MTYSSHLKSLVRPCYLTVLHPHPQLPTLPPIHLASGDPVHWLRLPEQHFDGLVILEDTSANLHRHVCLAQESPRVILGHRDTHFQELKHLEVNDTIELQNPDGTWHSYKVTEIEVLPAEDVDQRINEHRDPQSLLLMTCYPFHYIGPAPDRFVVWTHPVSSQTSEVAKAIL